MNVKWQKTQLSGVEVDLADTVSNSPCRPAPPATCRRYIFNYACAPGPHARAQARLRRVLYNLCVEADSVSLKGHAALAVKASSHLASSHLWPVRSHVLCRCRI